MVLFSSMCQTWNLILTRFCYNHREINHVVDIINFHFRHSDSQRSVLDITESWLQTALWAHFSLSMQLQSKLHSPKECQYFHAWGLCYVAVIIVLLEFEIVLLIEQKQPLHMALQVTVCRSVSVFPFVASFLVCLLLMNASSLEEVYNTS